MLKDRPRPRRLIRAGVIRLGHKEKKTKKRKDGSTYEVEYPVQDDHFLLHDAPDVAAVYGENVTELDVLLPFPDAARNFDAAYKVWAGGVQICRGDGEFVEAANPFRVEKNEDGKVTVHNAPGDTLVSNGLAQVAFKWNGQEFNPGDHVPCPGGRKADRYPHCAVCKASSMLKVLMARDELLRMAYYQVSTRSMRNYDTILGTLLAIQDEYGKVSGIRYHLRLVKQATTYKDDGGTRRNTERWYLELEPYPEDLLALVKKRLASHAALPGPETDEVLEGEVQEEDFDEAEAPAPPPFAEDGGPAEEPEGITPPRLGKKARTGNGDAKRPADPATLRHWLRKRAGWVKAAAIDYSDAHRQPDDEQMKPDKDEIKRLAAVVDNALQQSGVKGDTVDLQRHSVYKFLFHRDSGKVLTGQEVRSALAAWEMQAGSYEANEHAATEITAIVTEALKEAGQQELPLEEATDG